MYETICIVTFKTNKSKMLNLLFPMERDLIENSKTIKIHIMHSQHFLWFICKDDYLTEIKI